LKRLIKGASSKRLKEAKYDKMWNIEILYSYFYSRPKSKKQIIDAQTKAVMLVRASTAARNSDTSFIHQPSIKWEEDSVSIRFFRWKTQHLKNNKYFQYTKIVKLPEEYANVCAYRALREYMDLMKSHYEGCNHPYIWLHFNSASPVKKATLAKQTRETMEAMGIPKIYGCATIRHAAITFWGKVGFSFDQVMDRTGHRLKELVLKYYDKSDVANDLTASGRASVAYMTSSCDSGDLGAIRAIQVIQAIQARFGRFKIYFSVNTH
jgi:hypothetical protein